MLVIFDSDGVLVDSETIANRLLRAHLAEVGLPLSEEKVQQAFRGLSMASVVAKIERHLQRPLPEDFLDKLQQQTFQAFRQSLEPVNGVRAVLEWLQEAGVACCVASSGSYDKLAVTLRVTDLERYFTPHIFSAVDVKRGKPAPDLFLHAARQMGVSPADCVVVEDSLPGVKAARAAGMQVFAYCEPPVSPQFIEQMTHAGGQCFYSMANLPRYLSTALSRRLVDEN